MATSRGFVAIEDVPIARPCWASAADEDPRATALVPVAVALNPSATAPPCVVPGEFASAFNPMARFAWLVPPLESMPAVVPLPIAMLLWSAAVTL